MSKRGDIEFLLDIKEGIKRIESYVDKVDYDKFLKNIKTQDAIIRNLEIIGEAIKNISEKLKEKYKDIEWKKVAGMRDKIIHYYFGVNWDIVWSVIKEEIPKLKRKIEVIIKEIENKKREESW